MVKTVVGLMGNGPHVVDSLKTDPTGLQKLLDVAANHKVTELDTAAAYKGSEELLGRVNGCSKFAVSTKAPAFAPKSLAYDRIVANCNESLRALKTDKVDIYYLHGPDQETPIEEQCDAIGKLYAEGKFERFGISNIKPDKVRAAYEHCKAKGYCLPKVYQGGYNPLHRGAETELFPVLRELGMSYYAYSPLAGGVLAKKLEQILDPQPGNRLAVFPVFKMYITEQSTPALKTLHGELDKAGISILEATMRWFVHHSPLQKDDGFIIGASKAEQLDMSLGCTEKGPLDDSIVKAIDRLWESVKATAPPSSL